jgi:hypothetical protein
VPRQRDSDKELKKKYGGAGAVGDITGKNSHDKFIDVMSGNEKSIAEWRREVAPMKAAAANWRKEQAERSRQGRSYGNTTRRR